MRREVFSWVEKNWGREIEMWEGKGRIEACWEGGERKEEIGREGIERMREVVIERGVEGEMTLGKALEVSWKGFGKVVETWGKVKVEGRERSFKEICVKARSLKGSSCCLGISSC